MRRSKPLRRALIGVLNRLTIAVLVLCFGAAALHAAQDLPSREALGALALTLVNAERSQAGLRPLSRTRALDDSAQNHAQDMAERSYLAHVSPSGDTAFDRYLAAGGDRWQVVAENIGLCGNCGPDVDEQDIRKLHAGWMGSESHRENILSADLDSFGFGIAVDEEGRTYAVQMFAGPGSNEPSAKAMPPGDEVTRFLNLINRDRKALGVQPVEPRPNLNQAARTALDGGQDPLRASDLLQGVRQMLGPQWRTLATIVGRCGGCGWELTDADVDAFYTRWMNNPDYRAKLMSPEFAAVGFAMRASDNGSKIALSLIGVPLPR